MKARLRDRSLQTVYTQKSITGSLRRSHFGDGSHVVIIPSSLMSRAWTVCSMGTARSWPGQILFVRWELEDTSGTSVGYSASTATTFGGYKKQKNILLTPPNTSLVTRVLKDVSRFWKTHNTKKGRLSPRSSFAGFHSLRHPTSLQSEVCIPTKKRYYNRGGGQYTQFNQHQRAALSVSHGTEDRDLTLWD